MKIKSHHVVVMAAVFAATMNIQNIQAQTTNVGIGSTSPAEKLDVAGNVKADTLKPNALKIAPNAGSGKVLTSDASGNGTWQEAKTGTVGYGTWGDCSMIGISEYQPVSDSLGSNYGRSVSISGNYAIVGSPLENVGGNNEQGSASIYQLTDSKWVLMQKLVDTDGAAYDNFGYSVSISGNRVIVGSPLDDVGTNTDQGSAVNYFLSGGSWLRLTKVTDPGGAANDNFGYSVSVSDKNTIVGVPYDDEGNDTNPGSICFFKYQAPAWVFVQKVTRTTGADSDRFGWSVSISGNYAIAGTPYDDAGLLDVGCADILIYNDVNWSVMGTITDPLPNTSDRFGWSVSISGNYAIVGAPFDDPGGNNDQGSACIFSLQRNLLGDLVWEYSTRQTNPNGAVSDQFGKSVSICGDYAIVGAPEDDLVNYTNQGSAIIYTRIGISWQKIQYLTDPGGETDDQFGNSVSIDGASLQFLIGAAGAGNRGKVVFGKVN